MTTLISIRMISVEMQIEVKLGYSQNIDYDLTSIQRAGSTRTAILHGPSANDTDFKMYLRSGYCAVL